MSPEATALRSALNTVLKEVQVFERERLMPPILVAIQATAQNVLYTKGVSEGYDWRDIHMVINVDDRHNVILDPRPLSKRADDLLLEVFKEIANETNPDLSQRDTTPSE